MTIREPADTQAFRDYVDSLADTGDLLEIHEPVSSDGDLAACLSLLDEGPAVRFASVDGTAYRVVGNLLNSRERIAAALGVAPAELTGAIAESVANPITPVMVEDAPWREVVEPTDLRDVPVPTFFEQETGPYISAGVIFVRDVISGVANASYARFKVLGPDTAMLGVSPNHHLGRMVARAASVGRTLPIAVAIGNHPAVMLAACLYLGFGDDEAACAGTLLGEPLRMAATARHQIPVPVGSELVFEAEVLPDGRVDEGPVSEYHGMYHQYGSGFRTVFSQVSRRADAMFQVIVPGLHQEHILLGGVSIAAGLRTHLRVTLPNVVDVAVPDTAAGRTAAVVSLTDPQPGQALQAIMACFSRVPLIKQVVVVDDDIDVWNTKAVEWARMTRCRPERDLLVLPEARTDRSEPLQSGFVVSKLGVDATRRAQDRPEGFALARIAPSSIARARSILANQAALPRPSVLLDGITGFWS